MYDGAGNIKAIGTQAYRYDRLNRMVRGELDTGDATNKVQEATYDAYGNLISLKTAGVTRATPVTSGTNRLSAGSYDAGGNLTGISHGAEHYEYTYSALNTMTSLRSNTDQARIFVYDANDERIVTFDCVAVQCQQRSRTTYTIRDLGGRVLRIFEDLPGEPFAWKRDYIYRDSELLATVQPHQSSGPEQTLHMHLDHLGTPRQVTDSAGSEVAFHSYYPFGGEASDASQNEVTLKFTGHERDENGSSAGALDYMHARYCSPSLGRFLAIDPAKSARIKHPQSWNRYSYAMGNPIKLIDPDGREIVLASDKKSQQLRGPLIESMRRASFRKVFIEIASSKDFRVDLSVGKVADRAQVMKARKGDGGTVKFAQGLPKRSNGKLVGADLVIDLFAVKAVHPSDKTGVWTMGHELDHMKGGMEGALTGATWGKAWNKALAGDIKLPGQNTGTSNLVGEATFLETPDLSAEEAEKALVRYLSP